MKGRLYTLVLLTLLLLSALTAPASGSDRWEAPFAIIEATVGVDDSVLTLPELLHLVATRNPLLPSLDLRREAAQGEITQAGVRPNPELEAELGGVTWDTPGFDESEIGVSLSQEFELFGQRGARRKVAEAEWQTSEFDARVAAFDLYLETRVRYFALAHAQVQYDLSDISIGLAEDIVATIQQRIEQGAALQSELLLAQLELQRARLASGEVELDFETAQISLASLWAGDPGIRVVVPAEPDFKSVLDRITESIADSTRELITLDRHREELKAQRYLADAEAKPNLTLSSGYTRLVADKSNSLMFGISLPLPFRDQNHGVLQSLDAEIQRIDFERRQAQIESMAAVASGLARLRQLNNRHTALNAELLPTAEETYQTMQVLYQSGRLPYTNLLEANRALVELRFERNDIVLAFREQIIAMERLGGKILQAHEETNND
ncbi:MAG: TolC family protein [candidate division Zixibacteria bacterium]|nr:TolC family protein [candidate division Zixibacteria bacterium]